MYSRYGNNPSLNSLVSLLWIRLAFIHVNWGNHPLFWRVAYLYPADDVLTLFPVWWVLSVGGGRNHEDCKKADSKTAPKARTRLEAPWKDEPWPTGSGLSPEIMETMDLYTCCRRWTQEHCWMSTVYISKICHNYNTIIRISNPYNENMPQLQR